MICLLCVQFALSSAKTVLECGYLKKSIPLIGTQPVIVPGFEKCGTSELFHTMYIRGCFVMGVKKELKFLNRFCVRRSLERKTSHSNFFEYCKKVKKCDNLADFLKCWPSKGNGIPLDGTPAYSHTILLGQNNIIISAAQELKRLSPHSKSIWLLRNPVERAISAFYFFMKTRKYANCTLEAKIRQEKNFLRENSALIEAFSMNSSLHALYKEKDFVADWALLRRKFRNADSNTKNKLCPAIPEILIGSIYLPMLAHWVETMNSASHLILSSETFFMQPDQIVSEVVEPFVFEDEQQMRKIVKLRNTDLYDHEIKNKGNYERKSIDNDERCTLHCFFSPFNEALMNWFKIVQNTKKIMFYPKLNGFTWSAPHRCSCAKFDYK